jgi:hypothetical protein
VSDTPKTDKVLYSVDVCDGEDVVNVEFARQLERKLNVADLQMELLTKSNFQLREGRLELKQRIKRLEEAGNEMERYIFDQTNTRFIICAIQWREAKEAKP